MRVSDIVYLSPIKLNTWQTNRTIASLSVLYNFLLRKQCSIHWSQLRFALQWANASFNWNWMAFSGKRFFTSLLGPATQNTHKCNNFRDRAQNNNRLHPTPAYNSPLLLSLSVSHLYRLNGARLNVQNPLSGSTETDVEIQRREKKKKNFFLHANAAGMSRLIRPLTIRTTPETLPVNGSSVHVTFRVSALSLLIICEQTFVDRNVFQSIISKSIFFTLGLLKLTWNFFACIRLYCTSCRQITRFRIFFTLRLKSGF